MTGPYVVNKDTAAEVVPHVRFRHYKPAELEIARKFIADATLPGTYYFDVYLRTAASDTIVYEMQPLDTADAAPWMLRIDAICVKPGAVWIIEFKDRLRPSLIGQLLSYASLYKTQYQPKKPILTAGVVGRDDPTLHPILQEHEIRLILSPP